MESSNKNKDCSFSIPSNPIKKRKKSKSESDTLLSNTAGTQDNSTINFNLLLNSLNGLNTNLNVNKTGNKDITENLHNDLNNINPVDNSLAFTQQQQLAALQSQLSLTGQDSLLNQEQQVTSNLSTLPNILPEYPTTTSLSSTNPLPTSTSSVTSNPIDIQNAYINLLNYYSQLSYPKFQTSSAPSSSTTTSTTENYATILPATQSPSTSSILTSNNNLHHAALANNYQQQLLTLLQQQQQQQQQEQLQLRTQKQKNSSGGEVKNFEIKPKKESGIILDDSRMKKPSLSISQNSFNSNDTLNEIEDDTILSNNEINENKSLLRQEPINYNKGKELSVSRGITEEDNNISIKTLMSNITNSLIPLQDNSSENSTEYVLSKYRGIISDCEEMVNNFILSDALSKSELYTLLEPLNNSINKTENFFLTNRNLTIIVVGRRTQGKSKFIDAVFREECILVDEEIANNFSKYIFKIPNGQMIEIYELASLDNEKISVMGSNYILEAASQILSNSIIPDLIVYVCKANNVSNIIFNDVNILHELKECIQSCSLLMINVPIIPVVTHVDEVYPSDIISPEDYDEEKLENIQKISEIVMHCMRDEIELKTLDIFPISCKYFYKPNSNKINPRRDYRYNTNNLLRYIIENIHYLKPSSLTNHYHFATKLVMTFSVINKRLANATYYSTSSSSTSSLSNSLIELENVNSSGTKKAAAKVSKYYKKFNLDKYVIIFYMVIIIALECSQFKQRNESFSSNTNPIISKTSLYKLLISNINASVDSISINKMSNLNKIEQDFIESFLEFWKVIGFKEIGKMSLFQFSEAMLNKKFPMLGDFCNNSINLILKIVTGEGFDYDDVTLKIGFSAIQWFIFGKQKKKELIQLMAKNNQY